MTAEQRAVARRMLFAQLGWPQDTVLLVSVGTTFKYEGPDGTTLLDALAPVLDADPRVRLLVAGVGDGGDFAAARARTGGRVLAIGRQPKVGPLLTAADVYVESRPFPGTSASAEAAAHRVPVLTLGATPAEAAIFCAEPCFGATVVDGVEAYRDTLRALIADPRRGRAEGRSARERALATDAAWSAAVADVYAAAAASAPVAPEALGERPLGAHPLDPAIRMINERHYAAYPDPGADALVATLELLAASPAVRERFASMHELWHGPRAPFPAAFAAPGAEEDALLAVVAEFRRLAAARAAAAFVIAVSPEEADDAVAVLAAALDDAPELPVDLVIDLAPESVRPPGSLAVVAPGTYAAAWPAHAWRSAPRPQFAAAAGR